MISTLKRRQLFFLVGISVAGCDSSSGLPTPKVQLGQCPNGEKEGLIVASSYLSTSPDVAKRATFWFDPAILPAVAQTSQDGEVLTRQKLNAEALRCVLERLSAMKIVNADPVWYEMPRRLSTQSIVPILSALTLKLTWPQIVLISRHPFVKKVEPAPGTSDSAIADYPPEPADCPSNAEPADAKIVRLEPAKGKGRQPVVVELRDNGLLPEMPVCPPSDRCQDTSWERTILNTRQVSCVRRRLDSLVRKVIPDVLYTTAVGVASGPPVPPASQAVGTLKAFGVALTWDEAKALAQHPFVESIWTDSSLQLNEPTPKCPPDLTAPIPSPECPSTQEPGDTKISVSDRKAFMATSSPIEVLVSVRGGATICQLDRCSAPPCDANDRAVARWKDENLAAQHCVRASIGALGGVASADTLWLTNVFEAALTWAQIQELAKHPHVVSITASSGGSI